MSEILEVGINDIIQDPFCHFEYHSHIPYTTSYNNDDRIQISIQHQEQNLLPSSSFLRIQGKLTQEDGTSAVIAGTSLSTNSICHLFSEIRYDLNSITTDSCKNVGITSLMKGYPSMRMNQKAILQNAGWYTDEIIDANGNFDVSIPLSMLFGFAEDFQKIVCNARHDLILTRSHSDVNSITQTAAATVSEHNTFKFTINKIEWVIPYLIPADHNKAKLLRFLEKRPTLKMPFRSWELYEYPRLQHASKHIWNIKTSNQLEKPRYVILGFQTAANIPRIFNASSFKHCGINNARLFLNTQYYPYNNLNLDFEQNQYSLLYNMFLNFQSSYYGRRASESLISRNQFKNTSPLFIFDCSSQNESTKFGPVDVKIEFESRANIPENTTAFCLIIHDRVVEYKPLEGDVRVLI